MLGNLLKATRKLYGKKLGRQAEEGQPYVPFESKEEWELSYWLNTEGLSWEGSQGAIDCFWKLKWVSHTVAHYSHTDWNGYPFLFRSPTIPIHPVGTMLHTTEKEYMRKSCL